MTGNTFGLRLLAQPRVQAVALGLIAVIVVVFRAIQFVGLTHAPQWGYDLSFYWTAANHLLHGESIYSAAQLSGPYAPQGQDGFLYPPAFAAVISPLVWLAPGGAGDAEWIWSALGAAILIAVALLLLRTERLAERFPVLEGRGRWLVVAAALTFAPVIGELSIGNVHLVLLGLLTLGWVGIRRGDATGDWIAGAGLGAAAVIKVFPGVMLLWLIATRRYRAAVAMVVFAVGFAVITMPITGLEPWRQYPTVLANLAGVIDTTDTISPTMWLAPALGFSTARWLVTALGVAAVILFALRGGRERMPALSYAGAVVISVLIAPNVFHHYLAIFVLPMLLALGAGVPWPWIGLAYLLMSGGQQAAYGDLAWIVNRLLPTAGSLVLLAALARTRRIGGGVAQRSRWASAR